MHPSKAPCRYGMSLLFYQQFWHIVGPDVVEVVGSFLSTGRLLREACFTHVLVPKVNEPQDMTHPISLCNVIYKIGAKVLANRLKGILSSIISPYQSDFVPGRLISDNSYKMVEMQSSKLWEYGLRYPSANIHRFKFFGFDIRFSSL